MRSGSLVTVRLGSSRLPGKALAEIRGRTVLERLVDRVRDARLPDALVICTTTLSEDDAIVEAARRLGEEVFRGEVEDVLSRWLGAARAHDLDLIVVCDGDDMFCDPVHIDRVIECHAETGADYVVCEGLPFGTAPTGIATVALARVCARKTETNTEGQGRFFADEHLVSRATVTAPGAVRHPDARLTLDYPEDLELLEAIVDELEQPGRVFTLDAIVDLLRRRPDLVAINAGRQAEYWKRFRAEYPPVQLA
jgi:spore coat polysaccharide biosynthesis protein SpsF